MDNITPSLSLYQKSTLVVWGTGVFGEIAVCWLQQLGVTVSACCDNAEEKWGTSFHGVEVISPKMLQAWQGEKENLLVQLGLTSRWERPVVAQLEGLGITGTISFVDGMVPMLEPLRDHFIELYPTLSEEIATSCERLQKTYVTNYSITSLGAEEDGMILMLPRKTGDGTLEATLKKHQIPYTFGWHSPEKIASMGERKRKMKIISAVRDPIARDISDIFELISFETILFLASSSPEEVTAFLEEKSVQGYFDRYVEKHYGQRVAGFSTAYTGFFDKFSTYVTDVKTVTLDTKEGYTIFGDETVDLFMYQLERLNDIVAPLSQWMGVDFSALEHDNIASEKWIAPYYAAAKENLRFTQEYVDMAYSDPYVTHFYSPEQIETMKAKWQKNIR